MTTTKKRLDIQGLRAIAIIGVLLFHVWPNWLPGGFLGVDMFFALSGYLMAVLLNKHERITFNIAGDFYFRRFKRIVPVYLFTIVLSLISVIVVLCRFDYLQVMDDVKPALYFWSNMDVLFADNDYFKQLASTKFFLHTWSLAVEIQFYLCVPFIFTFLNLNNTYSLKVFLSTIFLLTSLLLYFCASDTWSFEFLPCRTWQFMAGISAFYFGRISSSRHEQLTEKQLLLNETNEQTRRSCFYSSASYFLIVVLLLTFSFNFVERLVNVVVIFSTSVLLYLGGFNESNRLLSNFVFVWIGDVSYTIYLVHWPVIQIFRYLSTSLEFTVFEGINIIVVSLVLSIIIHEYVEKPLLKISSLRDLLKTVACLYIIIFLLYASLDYRKERDFYPQNRQMKRILKHLISNETREVAVDLLSVEIKSKFNRYRASIPCPSNAQIYHTALKLPSYRKRWECEYKGKGDLNVLLIGNSHAHSSAVAWELALRGRYKQFYWFSTSGCLVFEDIGFFDCRRFANAAMDLIDEFQPDILIVMQRYPEASPINEENKVGSDRLFHSMQLFADKVQPMVKKAILFDRPMLEFPHENGPLEMSKRLLYGMDIKSMGFEETFYWNTFNDHNVRLDNIKCPKCRLINFAPFFCYKNYCLPYDPETEIFYFRDSHHLSTYGNYMISNYYREILKQTVNGTF